MKVKENPSLILAFHGMLGRKKQTSLLLILLTMVFSFLTAATIYSGSSAQALQDTRCELYGEWQYLRLSDTDTDAAQVRDNLPASAKVSTAIQDGIVLGADNGLAGGIGTVDSAFAQLGRIVPISGNFPAQPDEIAMTTTLLDALGCSYDLGQTITLKVADNDYDPLSGSGKIVEQTYTLCGVLPAYDVYWNLGSNLTVSAVVVEPLALAGQKFQTFYDADTVGTASDDPDFIANEYAYPQEDTVSSSLTFLLMIAILVSFFAVAQYFVIVLHKRVQTLHTFQILGARKQDLHRMCLWEALFAGLAAVFLGFALGCGAAAIGLGLQKQLSFFAVPFASLILLAVLFLIAVLLGAFLPAVLTRPKAAQKKESKAKKFHLAQLPLAPQVGVGCAVLLIAVSCLYVGWRVMLPYDLDAPYACLSIKMNGTSGMPFSLKEDLAALPGVEEVSAAIDLTDTYTVTSDKIQSSHMLADIWVKDNGFFTDIPSLLRNAEKGTLNTTVCALPEDELRRIAADAGVSDEEIETLLSGDSVLTLWGDCYYDPAADEYYQNTQTEGSIPVEPVFAAGDKLSIQYRRYTGQDEAGNEVYRTYTAQLPIVGVVKSANNYTLLTTDRLISSGTIFVSTALYHKMFESAGSYFMEKEGYSSLNVKLAADNNFSLRRSIASIATRRNGILSADNYDLLSQSYTEGTQSAFLVGILAVLGVLLGCALLVVLNLSAYEVQQQRLSLLLTLGVSPKKLVCSYAKRVIPVIVGTTLIVNILVSVAVSHIVPIQSILDLIRIHTDGRVFEFHRPVGSQILVSILLMGFWLGAALLPVFSFIRKKASKGDIL